LNVPYVKVNFNAFQLGKLGGKVKSPAKAAASRENGKLGGRPKKSVIVSSAKP